MIQRPPTFTLFPTRRSSDLIDPKRVYVAGHSNGGVLAHRVAADLSARIAAVAVVAGAIGVRTGNGAVTQIDRSEEHTSELQSRLHLVCRLLLEKKKYLIIAT